MLNPLGKACTFHAQKVVTFHINVYFNLIMTLKKGQEVIIKIKIHPVGIINRVKINQLTKHRNHKSIEIPRCYDIMFAAELVKHLTHVFAVNLRERAF